MRFLLNATSCVKGGGLQRAVSFVRYAVQSSGHEWCFALSSAIACDDFVLPTGDRVEVFESRPSRSRACRSRLQILTREWQPDCIYTLFGPAYVKVDCPHLMGVADPWVLYPSRLAYASLSGRRERLAMLMASAYKRTWFKRADSWVVESEAARDALSGILGDMPVAVVRNTAADYYRRAHRGPWCPAFDDFVQVLCFSAAYPHKRLDLIADVCRELESMRLGRAIRFIVTLPLESEEWLAIRRKAASLGVLGNIENVGPVAVALGPDLYKKSHIVFVPSVLEVSSASYPEAMAMGRPIVTSDLAFARDSCGPAALYFDAGDAADAARKIAMLVASPEVGESLVISGQKVLDGLPSPETQFAEQVSLMEELAVRHRRSQQPRQG